MAEQAAASPAPLTSVAEVIARLEAIGASLPAGDGPRARRRSPPPGGRQPGRRLVDQLRPRPGVGQQPPVVARPRHPDRPRAAMRQPGRHHRDGQPRTPGRGITPAPPAPGNAGKRTSGWLGFSSAAGPAPAEQGQPAAYGAEMRERERHARRRPYRAGRAARDAAPVPPRRCGGEFRLWHSFRGLVRRVGDGVAVASVIMCVVRS